MLDHPTGKVADTGTTYKYKMQLNEGEGQDAEQGEEPDPANITATTDSSVSSVPDPQTTQTPSEAPPAPAEAAPPTASPAPPTSGEEAGEQPAGEREAEPETIRQSEEVQINS